MEIKTLLKAGIKRHKSSLAGIFILTFIVSLAVSSVLSVWTNSGNYIRKEMERAGYGDITAWVSDVPEPDTMIYSIQGLPDVVDVETQDVIFANYTVNGHKSDSEGQLITYAPNENRYKFFVDDFSDYQENMPAIAQGEVYISPSLVSMFGVSIGDQISFTIARSGGTVTLTVKGYYEDPFMGSSMIGMKGFLICDSDGKEILRMIENDRINALARGGAMLHIFKDSDSRITVSELNNMLNEQTKLPEHTEFVHSANAIYGFMLILQNSFSGLMLAFAIVLLFITVVTLCHSITAAVEADFVNMAILKTTGLTSEKLRKVQLLTYLPGILGGLLLGLLFSMPLSSFICGETLTTTGILIPSSLPALWCTLSSIGIMLILICAIIVKTRKISRITPIETIRGERSNERPSSGNFLPIHGKALHITLALRQLLTGKHKYLGVGIIAVLLVFFASLVGHMDSWLGPDGKGMMDAFNPADHDIGVQALGDTPIEEMERVALSFSEVTDSYLLAMPGVSVNGIDYTANVISEPERFHILEGGTCIEDNEIVLTEFVASDLGASIGDTLTVRADKGSGEYVVSGIYQCANDMGDNIGMSREGYMRIGRDDPRIWCYHYFLADPSQKAAMTQALEDAYGGGVHIHENTWPGLFGIISAMRALMVIMYLVVAAFILIVSVMTGSRILSAEQRDLSIYQAIGFPTKRLRLTFALRFGITALLGSVIGAVLAMFFTDPLVSAVMKLAGISNFSSSPNLLEVMFPVVVVTSLFTGFAYIAAGKIKKVALAVLVAE